MSKFWKGSDYDDFRLLLLGESIYSWREDNVIVNPKPDHNVELVKDVIKGETNSGFMVSLSRAITGKYNPSEADRCRAWNKVAFTNYVNRSVGEGSRIRPENELWQEAKPLFLDLLGEIRPNIVIVLGSDLWRNMPPTPEDLYCREDVQGYRLDDGSTSVCWAIKHPTGGSSWKSISGTIYLAISELKCRQKTYLSRL